MIRFVDVGKQISMTENEFGFYCTVKDSFLSFGEEEFFISYSDFWMYYKIENKELIASEYNRFLNKIPDKYKI